MLPPVQPLPLPDSHYVLAATGWLELGNRTEAKAELAQVHPEWRQHPDVSEVWWVIHAEEHNWPAGLAVAREILMADPERVSGWLHQAYALRRVKGGGLEAAWAALLPAAKKFPKEPTVAFNLACYACQLGNLDEGKSWFKLAMKTGGKAQMKLMALADEDMKPLWPVIRLL